MSSKSLTIGVLAIQGNFTENINLLNKIGGVNVLDVRDSETLFKCDGLIIPGGESTTIGVVCKDYNLIKPLQDYVTKFKKPVWGICAGLILLSNKLDNSTKITHAFDNNNNLNANNQQKAENQPLIGGLSVITHRNYFGHQNKSSLRTIHIPNEDTKQNTFQSMSHFIRAPAIMKILNTNTVNELAYIYDHEMDNKKVTVAVEENNIMATAFHAEITENDCYWHAYFINKVRKHCNYNDSIQTVYKPISDATNQKVIYGSLSVKQGMPRMLQGGVIMDVVNSVQAKIAEEAGACSVMALERIPADIKRDGGVSRMSDPKLITEIMNSVSIPVMAKSRIGHFGEAKILQSLGVDCIDESEVLTIADEKYHIHKHPFGIPFVCGARDLGEALRRIGEGAAMIRLKGNAGTGNVMEAVRHARLTFDAIRRLKCMSDDEVFDYSKSIGAPLHLVQLTKKLRRLPVVTFAAGGISTPADVMLMMELGCDGVFVGSGIFKSDNPTKRARAIVHACTFYKKPEIVAKVSEDLGKAMVGVLNKGEKYSFIGHQDSKL